MGDHGLVSTTHAEVVRAKVADLRGAGLRLPEYAATVIDLLRQAVPYDSVCLATTDPSTGLLTNTFKADLPGARDDVFAHFEYEVDDINLYRDISQRRDPVGVLALDTEGRPEVSPRWRDFLVPYFGFHQELRASFRIEGQAWGAIGMYREGPTSGFSPAEGAFISGLSEEVGRGLRAAVVTSMSSVQPATPDGPAVVIVGVDAEVRSATPAALHLLEVLGMPTTGELPAVLHVLVSAARSSRDGRRPAVPRSRVRMPSGEWLVLHASALAGADGATGDVVVTMEPARPPDVVPLVVAAYGLTEREQDVVRLVLAGVTTAQIGSRLHLSPYTVQDHLKSIFDKAGVRSRRELTSQVFFSQYAPRVGDQVGPSGWFLG
jgi:DNA-binding CsgD family transcriptional regulator